MTIQNSFYNLMDCWLLAGGRGRENSTCGRLENGTEIWSRNRRRGMGPPQLLLVVATKEPQTASIGLPAGQAPAQTGTGPARPEGPWRARLEGIRLVFVPEQCRARP